MRRFSRVLAVSGLCLWTTSLAAAAACSMPTLARASMIDCIGAETRRQDARLNQAYKALMDSTAAERKKPLQEAQRAWVRFRDTNCAFYLDPDGGSLARVSANDCVLTMTVDRADELETLAE